ncbi:hypothetical protein M406DRAFT_262363, partial [Cryphonectria parasitica EP155]
PILSSQPFTRISINIQYIAEDSGYRYLAKACCNLTGYMLARSLKKAIAAEMRKFILEEIILVFGCSLKITINEESENKAEIAKIIRALGILLVQISSYNPHA